MPSLPDLSGLAFAQPKFLWLLLLIPLAAWIKGKLGGTPGILFSTTKQTRVATICHFKPHQSTRHEIVICMGHLSSASLLLRSRGLLVEFAHVRKDLFKLINVPIARPFLSRCALQVVQAQGFVAPRAARLNHVNKVKGVRNVAVKQVLVHLKGRPRRRARLG